MSYRKYSIEEIDTATENFSESLKIGEGGYGPVYKCYLDYTKAAVKVLSSDAAQGMTQFQKEVNRRAQILKSRIVPYSFKTSYVTHTSQA